MMPLHLEKVEVGQRVSFGTGLKNQPIVHGVQKFGSDRRSDACTAKSLLYTNLHG